MANDLRITSSVEAIINDSKSVGGKTYTIKEADKNVGSSSGTYTQTYTATDSVKHSGVVNVTNFTAIAGAFESVTTVGTAPAKAKALYVSHDSQIGSANPVEVEIASGVTVARLAVGESCVVPLSSTDGGGIAIAGLKIKDTGYVNGTKESTVTAVLIGD